MISRHRNLGLRLAVFGALVAFLGFDQPVLGQGRGELLSIAPDSQDNIDKLGRDVDRAQSLRDIKDLEALYIQYAEFGLWDEIGGLLADDVELWSDDKMGLKGQAAFVKHLKDQFNGGKEGIAPGQTRTEMLLQPVIVMSYDGKSATGRLERMIWEGQYGGPKGGTASISGGMQVNDYVKVNVGSGSFHGCIITPNMPAHTRPACSPPRPVCRWCLIPIHRVRRAAPFPISPAASIAASSSVWNKANIASMR